MTQTTATQADAPPETPLGSDNPVHPSDVLMHLIVAFLAPMFLTTSGGDVNFARIAAIQTVNAYHARDHIDLLAIAQIIGCGLASLGSLSLSMTDNLSLSMTLRLRSNAVALNRAAEQSRRVLTQPRTDAAKPEIPADQAVYEAEVLANVAAAQKMTAEAQTRLQHAEPTATPAPATPTLAPPTLTPSQIAIPTTAAPDFSEQQWQAMWATAMTDVAGEFTADLANLSPAERMIASRRAAMLSTCANQLIAGDVPPPPQPGDFDHFHAARNAQSA